MFVQQLAKIDNMKQIITFAVNVCICRRTQYQTSTFLHFTKEVTFVEVSVRKNWLISIG
jgi:hypothetical protein